MSISEVDRIRAAYMSCKTICGAAKITGYAMGTIIKYVRDLRVVKLDPRVVGRVYRVNGTLQGTAKALGISTTTVWRHLQKCGIKVGNGAVDSVRLYRTLRARVSRSDWRQRILDRDNRLCTKCNTPSITVHHITKLSEIRDYVLLANPSLNPFGSFRDLREFTDAVMMAHDTVDGIVLCNRCHDLEHSSK